MFRKNNTLTIGKAIMTAVSYKNPVEPSALFIAVLKSIALPIGKLSKLLIINSKIIKCQFTEKKRIIKNNENTWLITGD